MDRYFLRDVFIFLTYLGPCSGESTLRGRMDPNSV